MRWTMFGYAAGLGTSYAVARRVKRSLAQLTPPEVARRSSRRVRDALTDGRAAMRAREAELQREFGRRTTSAGAPPPHLRAVDGAPGTDDAQRASDVTGGRRTGR